MLSRNRETHLIEIVVIATDEHFAFILEQSIHTWCHHFTRTRFDARQVETGETWSWHWCTFHYIRQMWICSTKREKPIFLKSELHAGDLDHPNLLIPNVMPSSVGNNDRVIISAALRGRVNGITECGNVFGLIGVMSICSVHDVSSDGRSSRSTSTFNVFCSNGTENVSCGMLCNQLNSDKSESLNPIEPSSNLEKVISCCEQFGAPVAFAWQ